MKRSVALLAAVAMLSGLVSAEDAFYSVPVRSLELTGGELPGGVPERPPSLRISNIRSYTRVDGAAEAYLAGPHWQGFWEHGKVVLRAPAGQDVTGRLYLADSDGEGMVRIEFKLPAGDTTEGARAEFYRGKQQHYERLFRRALPGGAWFRHQVNQASVALGDAPVEDESRLWRDSVDELEDTYAVFTGGRAMSENLELDRLLAPGTSTDVTVDINSLPGITVAEIDWAPLIEEATPVKDPLAQLIPADQHALFFPSFRACAAMVDESKANGTPILQLLEPRAEDARALERYERQLCISMDKLARMFGPTMVASVALTGSDPYLRTGSDVAVLLEAKNPEMLLTTVGALVSAAARANANAEPAAGNVMGVGYTLVRTADRSVCSYVAGVGNAVVVTNSLYQLRRIVSASRKETPSLGSLPEYTFMRDRYPRGEGGETAFLMLSDATIRRWCGARWRIGASRRTRAAALMLDLQARRMEQLVRRTVQSAAIETDMVVPEQGEIRIGPGGVSSSVYGTPEFLTPIAELPLDTVTEREAETYEDWRSMYHNHWRRFFDPIAVRFVLSPERMRLDVTVMPLIEWSEYNDIMETTGKAAVPPDGADPHDGTLIHFAMAIDEDSEPARMVGNMAHAAMPGLLARPLAWLGQYIALYADKGSFWEEVAEAAEDDELEDFVEENFFRAPVALHVDVKSGVRLAAFLAAVRAFTEESAPGMTRWETLSHKDQAYVKVSPTAEAIRDEEELRDLALYYAPGGKSLILSLNENVLKRALDRQAARTQAPAEGRAARPEANPWLGRHMCLKVDKAFLAIIMGLIEEQFRDEMLDRSWDNLQVLTEWKLLYPDLDPVQLHRRLWQTQLVCPAGGEYVWNPEWETMMSTGCGHPNLPKEGPAWPPALRRVLSGNFGLTFEDDGLRARVEIRRGAMAP